MLSGRSKSNTGRPTTRTALPPDAANAEATWPVPPVTRIGAVMSGERACQGWFAGGRVVGGCHSFERGWVERGLAGLPSEPLPPPPSLKGRGSIVLPSRHLKR